jgi:uncharacterized protein YjiK
MPRQRGRDCLDIGFVNTVAIHDPEEDFHEPSGLTLQPDTGHLWAVSDDEKRLFRLDLDGTIDPESVVDVGVKDFEGIAWMASGRLAVVRETDAEILIFEPGSAEPLLRRKVLEMENSSLIEADFEASGDQKGLEGITCVPDAGALFVVKEGKPRLLLEISQDLKRIVARHELSAERGFVADGIEDDRLDVSGLCCDPHRAALWIVSDTGCCVFLYDPVRKRAMSAPLIHGNGRKRKLLRNAEGVALDASGHRLFVVTDDRSRSKLATFDILGPVVGPASGQVGTSAQ